MFKTSIKIAVSRAVVITLWYKSVTSMMNEAKSTRVTLCKC